MALAGGSSAMDPLAAENSCTGGISHIYGYKRDGQGHPDDDVETIRRSEYVVEEKAKERINAEMLWFLLDFWELTDSASPY